MIPCGSCAFQALDFEQLSFHIEHEHQQQHNHAADNKVYYYKDSATGKSSKPVRNKRIAIARMRDKQGALRLGLDKQLTRRYGLDKITEADVDDLIKVIEKWELTLSDVSA